MKDWQFATATAYNGKDDVYGSITARPNPYGKCRAIPNFTIAVDPAVIPYGSMVEVELKNGEIRTFCAHDTGSDVVKRTASHGRGNQYPVIDFYTPADNLERFNAQIGEVVKWRLA